MSDTWGYHMSDDGPIVNPALAQTYRRVAAVSIRAGMVVAYRPDHPLLVYPYPRVLTGWQRFWQRFQAPVVWIPIGVTLHGARRGQEVTIASQIGTLTTAVMSSASIETKEGEPIGYVDSDGKMLIGRRK